MLRFGKLMAEKDGEGAGGQGKLPLPEKKDGDGEQVDYKAKFEALQGETGKLLGRLDKLETGEKERELAKKDLADKERLKKEGAETIIKEKDQALSQAQERLAAFEKREKDRAGKIFESLPKERQAALTDLGLEKKLDLADWVSLLEKESHTEGDGVTKPPHVGGGRVPRTDPNDRYQPTTRAAELLAEMGKDTSMLKQLEHVRDTDTGASKFRMPINKYFKEMKKAPINKLTSNNALQRQGK